MRLSWFTTTTFNSGGADVVSVSYRWSQQQGTVIKGVRILHNLNQQRIFRKHHHKQYQPASVPSKLYKHKQ